MSNVIQVRFKLPIVGKLINTNAPLFLKLTTYIPKSFVCLCVSGYYRVNYDDTLWSALETALKSDNFDGIHVLNRAQIVDDALNLARAGQLSYSTALNIVSYLENETEYYPWYSAFTAFTYLNRLIGSHQTLGPYFTVNQLLIYYGFIIILLTYRRISFRN